MAVNMILVIIAIKELLAKQDVNIDYSCILLLIAF